MKTPPVQESIPMNEISVLLPVLQKGFAMKVFTGCSVQSLMSEQWGLSTEYIKNRVSVVFMDGKPLDDLDSALLTDQSTLVLSGAMPGLVGAAMRRGSVYNTLRNTITYLKTEDAQTSRPGFIKVKLFNVLMKELGPILLARGIYIERNDLETLPGVHLTQENSPRTCQYFETVECSQNEIPFHSDGWVFLRCKRD
jgi:hypothetical protein